MNLYEISVAHYAPKDSHESIQTYLLADNEEQVYDFINENYIYGLWDERSEEDGELDVYNNNYEVIGVETYKAKMLRFKGDLNDPDDELEDLYYGQTRFGWSLLKEGITEYKNMIDLGIFKTMDTKTN